MKISTSTRQCNFLCHPGGRCEERRNPLRTVYLAFGDDEELGGQAGAKAMAELLERRGIKPELARIHVLAVTCDERIACRCRARRALVSGMVRASSEAFGTSAGGTLNAAGNAQAKTADVNELDWLFDRGRSHLEQLEYYRAVQGGP